MAAFRLGKVSSLNMKLNNLKKILDEKESINKKILKNHKKIDKIINKITNTFKDNSKVYTCGNGGSAGDAQHVAAEGVVRLKPDFNRKPLPIISLALDISTLTACANDYGYNFVFSRSLEALANKNDLLICYSTSGNSKNIIEVLKTAKKMKVFSICFLGNNGGVAKKYTDIPLIIENKNVARVQEAHIFLSHYILEEVEKNLLDLKII